MFPDVDFRHFIISFIAQKYFLCIYNIGYLCFMDVEKSIKIKQIFLKPNQIFVFVFPESFSIEMSTKGVPSIKKTHMPESLFPQRWIFWPQSVENIKTEEQHNLTYLPVDGLFPYKVILMRG